MSIETTVAVAVSPEQPFEFRTVELLPPQSNEIRVRIEGTGICHTDIAVKEQFFALPLPMVLGHEGAGVVEEIGSAVSQFAVGDHVVLAGDSCGQCKCCHTGLMSYCEQFAERNLMGVRMDGSTSLSDHGEDLRGRFVAQSSFATNVIATERGAIRISKDLPLELMGPLGCGLTTGVGTVQNALRPEPGSAIAVFGAGTVAWPASWVPSFRL